MINADEHKKLLAQIAELEKTSVNYFDVEKEFFLIDSNNLSQVRPRLYGYSIQRNGIYEDDNLTPEAIAGLDGRGCYIYVDVKDGEITIKQDLNGCWGIYLFRHSDYFALSNSFFRLLDHIKFKYPLTLNRDYCNYLMINALCSHAYLETAVNEIQLVDRNAILHIDITKKNIDTEFIDYKEHSVSPDSEKGISILDNWIEFWSNIIRGVAQHTKFISLALSGGFDTRIALVSLLHSGIDLNDIQIYSIKGTLHTFTEDYKIASKIANHYGFKLNQPLPTRQLLRYSINDIFNFDLYGWQTFTAIPKLWSQKNIDKVYLVDGSAGEILRGNWLRFGTWENFINLHIEPTKNYSLRLSNELSNSIKSILNHASNNICNKFKIKKQDSGYIQQYLYQEIRCRNHFGKGFLSNFLRRSFSLSPAIDPEIQTLQFNTPECPDYQLLMALIFTRYEPDLLKFPFQGNRSIAPETIEYAKKINERFPLVKKNKESISGGGIFHLQPRDTQAEKILSSARNNPSIPRELPEACLKATFESSKTYGLFTVHFDEELYRYAASFYDSHPFESLRLLYAVVGVAKVLEDVEISQRNYPKYQDMKRFLERDFAKIHDDAKIINKFSRYFTSRIDIKFISKTAEGNFQILSASDNRANIIKPAWLNNGGVGYMITSYTGNLEFVAKATADGQIRLNLRGLDVRDPKDNSKRIPYWIDYTKLIVNGKVVFDELTPAWHDKAYNYNMDVKAGVETKIQVEWLPHRSDDVFTEIPKTTEKVAPVVDKVPSNPTVKVESVQKPAKSDAKFFPYPVMVP